MPRYVAFLRGVSPMNARMPELKACFEAAGFGAVRTLLSSGNVVFDTRASAQATLERRAERAMQAVLGHAFGCFVRRAGELQQFIDADPYAEFALPASAKRVVTFLRRPAALPFSLPLGRDGAGILKSLGSEVLSAYVPGPKGPVFMRLLEQALGPDITTRTLDTVRKCAWA